MTQHTCQNPTDGNSCVPRGVTYSPAVDIQETDQEIVLFADLPGADADSLNVRYEDGELAIEAKVARRSPDALLRHEFASGDFYRSFTIGEGVDVENISASIKDGVMTLRLPKSEAVKSRRIEVKSA